MYIYYEWDKNSILWALMNEFYFEKSVQTKIINQLFQKTIIF